MAAFSMWKEEKHIKLFKRVIPSFTPLRWYQEVIITPRWEGGESTERTGLFLAAFPRQISVPVCGHLAHGHYHKRRTQQLSALSLCGVIMFLAFGSVTLQKGLSLTQLVLLAHMFLHIKTTLPQLPALCPLYGIFGCMLPFRLVLFISTENKRKKLGVSVQIDPVSTPVIIQSPIRYQQVQILGRIDCSIVLILLLTSLASG